MYFKRSNDQGIQWILQRSPTYSRHHCSNKIKSPCKIPSWSQSISPDPCGDGSLVLPQEGVEVLQADVEGLTEVQERPVPAAVSPQLRGPLYGREDRSAAQQVQQDEDGEQREAAVVLVEVQGAAALQSLARHHPNFSTTRASDSDELHMEDGVQRSAGTLRKPLSHSLISLPQATFPSAGALHCLIVVVEVIKYEAERRKNKQTAHLWIELCRSNQRVHIISYNCGNAVGVEWTAV